MNTSDYLLQSDIDENAPVLITAKEEFSYRDLKRATLSLVEALLITGLLPGDPIGILGRNSLFWVASYLAIMKIGAIAVPFATKLPKNELSEQIKQTGCKALCVEKLLRKRYTSAFPTSLGLVDEKALEKQINGELPVTSPDFNEDQDAAWMLTSGTTGKPHIVRVTHRNIQANTASILQYLELNRRERIMAILPFYYCFGTSLLHTHLRVGGSLVLGDAIVFPEKVLDLMEEKACTGFAGVPTTFQIYLRNSTFPERKLPALQKIQQAGGKLSNILIEELISARPDAKIYIMYGQTEATARLSYLPPDMLKAKIGSVGQAIPDVKLSVLDKTGREVSPGEMGEITAQGENISPGYLNEAKVNAEKFTSGSLKTGDMATVDEEGFIYILDRKSDFIKSYGNRVSSQEVETCILELKEVIAVAVVRAPDPLRGEAICAFVVLCANARITEKEIITHCAKRLARYMIPRDVIFTSSLPTNQHGKVLKSQLEKMVS